MDKTAAEKKWAIPGLPVMLPVFSTMSIKEMLAQGWEMEDDLDALGFADRVNGQRIPFRSFYLAPDGTFIKNPRNAIEFGKWSCNEDAMTLTLNYDTGGKDIYKIRLISPKLLELTDEGMKSITILKYVSGGSRYSNNEQNPFYKANNNWRIPASKPEPEEAIRKRLKENVRFFLLFYKDVIAKKSDPVSFYGLPSCLKFYGPGIFMRPKNQLSQFWIECFYNEEQAMIAYNMMRTVIAKKYDWPKENIGWLKKNTIVLEQVYDNL